MNSNHSERYVKADPVIIMINSQGEMRQINLASFRKDYVTIGRGSRENDIVIPDSIVSSVHGYLVNRNGRFYYKDLKSKNGSYAGTLGHELFLHQNSSFVELSEGSVVKIGNKKKPDKMVLLWFTYMNPGETIGTCRISKTSITIGRSAASDIVLNQPSISRTHCIIHSEAGRVTLQDNNSLNGVFVNGQKIEGTVSLQGKDIIQILGNQMIFGGSFIYYKKKSQGIAIKGITLDKWVGKKDSRKQILQNANINIQGNEFVAIIGGSGAGKSTLMGILNGSDMKFEGDVYYNSLSLKENFNHLKRLVGYVPQEDIIYENLKLRRMLYYTAILRMPNDTTKQEIEERIDYVLNTLDLKEHQDTYIRKLSGGQKKRASIAVELLADPKLFFLDEPTSGLDPGMEKSLMETLRTLSKKQDRTIVMVTHTTQNLDLCDKVIFMGPGGRVCFVGSVDGAKEFFQTDDLTSIYNLIHDAPEMWSGRFAAAEHSQNSDVRWELSPERKKMQSAKKTSSGLQFCTVVRRYLELMCNDRKRLAVLLLQPILIGVLLSIVADDDIFDIYESTKSMMFVLSCSAIWLGVFDSIQEICKERNILRREYMAGLKMGVYILSKLFVQCLLGAVQSICLVFTFLLIVKGNEEGILFDSFYLEILVTVWLTVLASIAMGFIISAIVRTGDKAMAAAPFVLIVQLLFSGILFELKGVAEYISYITVSRWSVEALGSIVHLNDLELRMQADIPTLEHEAESLFDATKSHLMQDWGILAIMTAVFMVISLLLIRNVSRDER